MLRVVAGRERGISRGALVAAAVFFAFGGCSSAASDPSAPQPGAVRYRNAPALGTWPADVPNSDEQAADDPTPVEGPNTDTAPTLPNGIAGSAPVDNGSGGMGMAGTTMAAAGRTGSGGMGGGGIGSGGATGSGGMGSGGMGSGGASGGAGATFAFDVMTVDQGGRYAPRNVGAIWIETSSGTFVKTLKVWARTRGRYLTKFNAEAGGSRVDAVTAATLRPFTSHHVTWDLTDVNGMTVANGAYKVLFEVTDHDGTGKWGEVAFELTGDPATMMPPDQQYFTNMQITLQ